MTSNNMNRQTWVPITEDDVPIAYQAEISQINQQLEVLRLKLTTSQQEIVALHEQQGVMTQKIDDLTKEVDRLNEEIASQADKHPSASTVDFTQTILLEYVFDPVANGGNYLTSLIPDQTIAHTRYLTVAWGYFRNITALDNEFNMRFQLAIYRTNPNNDTELQIVAFTPFWIPPALGTPGIVPNQLYGVTFELNQLVTLESGNQYYVDIYMQYRSDMDRAEVVFAGLPVVDNNWPTRPNFTGFSNLSFPAFRAPLLSQNGIPGIIQNANVSIDDRRLWIMASQHAPNVNEIDIPFIKKN